MHTYEESSSLASEEMVTTSTQLSETAELESSKMSSKMLKDLIEELDKKKEVPTGTGISLNDIPLPVFNVNGVEVQLKLNLKYDAGKTRYIASVEASNTDSNKYTPPFKINTSSLLNQLGVLDQAASAILDIDIVIRKIEFVYKWKVDTSDPSKLSESCWWLSVYSDKKSANKDLPLNIPGTQPTAQQPPTSRPDISDTSFFTVASGKKISETKKWFAVGLSPRVTLNCNPALGDSNNWDTFNYSPPLISKTLPPGIGIQNPTIIYTRHCALMDGEFVKSHWNLLGFETAKNEKKDDNNKPKDWQEEDVEGKKDDGDKPKDWEGKDVTEGAFVTLLIQFGQASKFVKFQLTKGSGQGGNQDSGQSQNQTQSQGQSNKKPVLAGSKECHIKLANLITLQEIKIGRETIKKTLDGKEVEVPYLSVSPQIILGRVEDKKTLYLDLSGLTFLINLSFINNSEGTALSLIDFEFRGVGFVADFPSFAAKGALSIRYKPDLQIVGMLGARIGPKDDPILALAVIGAILIRDGNDPLTAGFLYGCVVFGKKGGIPLIPALEVAHITGFALGGGVNYKLTIPEIEELDKFPLLQAARGKEMFGPELKPSAILDKLKPYFEPKEYYGWAAVGLELTVLKCLAGFALVILQWGGSTGVSAISLVGVLVFEPPIKSGSFKTPVHLEILIKATVSLEKSCVEVRARFTDDSYVLDSLFKVEGGAAICVWWGGSHAGDVVVTFGGYHPGYQIPTHFPQEKRIRIYTDLSQALKPGSALEWLKKFVNFQASGEAYLAYTPGALHVGIAVKFFLETTFILHIQAWLLFCFDAIAVFDPFYLQINAALQLGVKVTVDLWLVRITFSFTISAQFDFYAPPINGTLTFKVLGKTITIGIGAGNPSVPKFSKFPAFVQGGSGSRSLNTSQPLSITMNDGVIKDVKQNRFISDPPSGKLYACDYVVDPEEFRFTVSSRIPIKAVTVNSVTQDKAWNDNVGVAPCGLASKDFDSAFSVTIKLDGQVLQNIDQSFHITYTKSDQDKLYWNPTPTNSPTLNDKDNGKVRNVLMGLSLSGRCCQQGKIIGPVSLSSLAETRPFAWPNVVLPTRQDRPLPIAEYQQSIHLGAAARRATLLTAMQRQQQEIRTSANLSQTNLYAHQVLLAEPVCVPLGR